MIVTDELDIAVHPAHHHPLDPFAGGRLVTRRVGDTPQVVVADPQILLDCGFLWDILTMSEAFRPWCQIIPPDNKLELKVTFVTIASAAKTYGKPTRVNPRPMCPGWVFRISVDNRIIAYKIGSYRPSINAMEASWA